LNGDSIAVLNTGKGAVGITCYSDDGNMILSCCGDSTMRIWNSPANALVRTIKGFTSGVQCAAWTHDGSMVASVSGDSGLQLWETATGALLRSFPRAVPSTWPVLAMKLLPDNSQAILVTQVGEFYIVNCDNGKLVKTYNPEHSMEDVAFTDDGTRFALGTWGGKGGVYRVDDGALIESFNYFDEPIIRVGFFGNDTRAFAISMDGSGIVWKLQ
jgi:WD40 repeat protein